MMNVVAICLVLTSLATAGVFSPTQEKQSSSEDVLIVKEGHRVVVVEYEKGDGNTKVSISPQEAHEVPHNHKPSEVDDNGYITSAKEKLSSAAKTVVEDGKEKLKEAASVLPNVGQVLSGSYPQENCHRSSPKELVCDAFGKRKHKIASALGKTTKMVSEKVDEVSGKAHEAEEEAREAVSGAVGKAKETVKRKTHEASDKTREVGERMKDAASKVSGKAQEAVSQKASELVEEVKETGEKAKHAAQSAVDTSKRIGEDIERNLSRKMETVKGEVAEKANQAKDTAEHGAHRLKEVVQDVVAYLVPPATVDLMMGVLQLLGFATAYGMCMWITFVSSYVLAGALPRQQFGMVQSKIYPVYFTAMAYSVGLALLGHLLSHRSLVFSSMAEMIQGYILLWSLLMVLANLLYLEPQATKVMFERMKIEKEEGRGRVDSSISEPSSKVADPVADPVATPATRTTTTTTTAPATTPPVSPEVVAVKSEIIRLNVMLKKLNAYSSFLNVLTLMALTWHLVYLGQRPHTPR